MRNPRGLLSLALHHGLSVLDVLSGRTDRFLRQQQGKVLVLMYHRVVADSHDVRGIDPGMYVRASTFEKHVRWLARRWQLVTLGEAAAAVGASNGRPRAVVT
jgi:hypothetical protein